MDARPLSDRFRFRKRGLCSLVFDITSKKLHRDSGYALPFGFPWHHTSPTWGHDVTSPTSKRRYLGPAHSTARNTSSGHRSPIAKPAANRQQSARFAIPPPVPFGAKSHNQVQSLLST